MPYRIIRSCIVMDVKPHELIAALMAKEGGSLPLARKMGKPKLQPSLHRFAAGGVDSPAMTTAKPLAAYFKLPLDAIYDEKTATQIAKERGVVALPPRPPSTPRRPRASGSAARLMQRLSELEDDDLREQAAQTALAAIERLVSGGPQRRGQPTRLAERVEAAQQTGGHAGGMSAFGDLDEPAAPAEKKRGHK